MQITGGTFRHWYAIVEVSRCKLLQHLKLMSREVDLNMFVLKAINYLSD